MVTPTAEQLLEYLERLVAEGYRLGVQIDGTVYILNPHSNRFDVQNHRTVRAALEDAMAKDLLGVGE